MLYFAFYFLEGMVFWLFWKQQQEERRIQELATRMEQVIAETEQKLEALQCLPPRN